jgi:ABC-type polysaccharide/polyol phosphate export systems, permease component
MNRSKLDQIIASVLLTAIYWMRNYPISIVASFLQPIAIIAIITFVSKGALVGVAVEGALIATFVMNGILEMTDISHLKNDFKIQDMVIASPTSAFSYILGMSFSSLVTALPSIVFILILWYLFVHVTIATALVCMAVIVLLLVLAISIGFFLSTRTTDISQSYQFTSILSLLFTTVAPVYYPISLIPMPYRYLAYLSPITYGAEIIQNATGYLSISALNLAADWLVLIGLTAVVLFFAIKDLQWRDA